MQHFAFDNPFAGLSKAERKELMARVGRKAEKDFSDGFAQICSLVRVHDPLELLAGAALYSLFTGMRSEEDSTADGPYTE